MQQFKYICILLLFIINGNLVSAQETIPLTIDCGDNMIAGDIQLSTPETTHISVQLFEKNNEIPITIFDTLNYSNSGYYLTIDPTAYNYKEYIISIIAEKNGMKVTKNKHVFLGSNACNSMENLWKRIEWYAEEAKEYFKHAKNKQKLPISFLATGLGNLLEKTIANTEQKFAMATSTVYHDLPIRSYSPNNDQYTSFAGQYELLPIEYRSAEAYFRFKGLLIPIQSSIPGSTEKELLKMLNKGAILAPGIDSLDDTGIIKIIYNHAVSMTKSPFAGVGSHLSVFSELGDELKIYTKVPGYNHSYKERTYFLQHKLELLPKETKDLNAFKKEGVDILAFITCKYGNVLGSLKGREVLLFKRKTEELGDFQNAIIHINTASLATTKQAIDNYFVKKDLSDEDVARLVTKLEELEQNNTNQLKIIATYGKYMAAYDALYN